MNLLDILPTILYLFLFLLTEYWFFIKRFNLVSRLVVGIWIVSSFFAVLYEIETFPLYSDVSVIPFLYLFVCFFISLYPLVKYGDYVVSEENIEVSFYKKIMWIFIVISIIPFVENLIYVLHNFTSESSASSLSDVYDEKIYL